MNNNEDVISTLKAENARQAAEIKILQSKIQMLKGVVDTVTDALSTIQTETTSLLKEI